MRGAAAGGSRPPTADRADGPAAKAAIAKAMAANAAAKPKRRSALTRVMMVGVVRASHAASAWLGKSAPAVNRNTGQIRRNAKARWRPRGHGRRRRVSLRTAVMHNFLP